MIRVNCPTCGKQLKAQDDAPGKQAKCPQCGQLFKVQISSAPEGTRSRPRLRDVRGGADAGPNTSRAVGGTPTGGAHRREDSSLRRTPPSGGQKNEILAIVALVLPLGAVFFGWFWISNMRLIDNPGSKLMGLATATVFLTSLLIAYEASQLGIGSSADTDAKGRKRTGPLGWFLFCLLLWAIGFPAYMYWRSRYGVKNLVVGGILVALVFTGFLVGTRAMIAEAQGGVRKAIERATDGGGMDTTGGRAKPSRSRSYTVTRAEFEQLETGMSYQEAVEVIGAEGEEISRSEVMGTKTVMYQWTNYDASNMNAMFQNGKLIQKAQFGLK